MQIYSCGNYILFSGNVNTFVKIRSKTVPLPGLYPAYNPARIPFRSWPASFSLPQLSRRPPYRTDNVYIKTGWFSDKISGKTSENPAHYYKNLQTGSRFPCKTPKKTNKEIYFRKGHFRRPSGIRKP